MRDLIADSKRAYRQDRLGFIFQLSLIALSAWAVGSGIAYVMLGHYTPAIGILLGFIAIVCWDRMIKRNLKAIRAKEQDAKHKVD